MPKGLQVQCVKCVQGSLPVVEAFSVGTTREASVSASKHRSAQQLNVVGLKMVSCKTAQCCKTAKRQAQARSAKCCASDKRRTNDRSCSGPPLCVPAKSQSDIQWRLMCFILDSRRVCTQLGQNTSQIANFGAGLKPLNRTTSECVVYVRGIIILYYADLRTWCWWHYYIIFIIMCDLRTWCGGIIISYLS